MKLVRVTPDNLEAEDICCAIARTNQCQAQSKKKWMMKCYDEGLVFLKGDVDGKCFIEYIPAENAWAPIEADGYMYINCLRVSSKFQGLGFSRQLFDECIRDAKAQGKKGLVILSSRQKHKHFVNYDYLKYKGFRVVDEAAPYFVLMCLPFERTFYLPRFKPDAKRVVKPELSTGFCVYYTNQCPFTERNIELLRAAAERKNVDFKAIRLETREQAQRAKVPYTTFSLYYHGVFITHEILTEHKFNKLLE